MFIPAKFKQTDLNELRRFVAAHPLATLVVAGASEPQAAHIPVFWHDDGSEYGLLRGHFAKANPIWQADADADWLAICQNNGHYLSPNWYPSKARDHKAVPTWNYQAVHLRGRLRLLTEATDIHALLATLTRQHEAGQPQPWRLEDAPADYLAALSRAIVCFEMPIRSIEAQYKLSQNHSTENRHGVITGLQALHTPAADHIAAAVTIFAPDIRDDGTA